MMGITKHGWDAKMIKNPPSQPDMKKASKITLRETTLTFHTQLPEPDALVIIIIPAVNIVVEIWTNMTRFKPAIHYPILFTK